MSHFHCPLQIILTIMLFLNVPKNKINEKKTHMFDIKQTLSLRADILHLI